jgi:hypothetical protein
MIRKFILVALTLIMILTVTSCNKDKGKLPDGKEKVTEYATINSVKSLFLALNSAEYSFLNLGLSKADFKAKGEAAADAFNWGMVNADLLTALASNDVRSLQGIASHLKTLSPTLALSNVADEFDQRSRQIVKEGNIREMDKLVSGLITTVDLKMMDAGRYDLYTYMSLGAWTQAVHRLASLLEKHGEQTRTGILIQTENWDNLLHNLQLIDATDYHPGMEKTLPLVKQLAAVSKQSVDGTLNKAQMSSIVALTDSLIAVYK